MGIRSKLTHATGVALLATGLVALPGAAWATTPAPADTSAPAADGPQLGTVQLLHTATGTVLSLPVTSTAGATQVTVTATQRYNAAAAYTFTLSLASGTANDGVWQTTSALGLPFDDYSFTGTAVDANSHQTSGSVYSGYAAFQQSLAFEHVTFSSDHLTVANPHLEVKGEVTGWDPNTGDTGQPATGAYVQIVDDLPGNHGIPAKYPVGQDGTFDITDYTVVDFGTALSSTYTVQAESALTGDWVNGPSQLVSKDADVPTRVVLDQPSQAHLPAGGTVTITGTAQYQAADGTWHNLPNTLVQVMHGSAWEAWPITDATGRFTAQARIPITGQTWTAFVENTTWYDEDPTDFTFTVDQQLHLSATGASVNALSQLSFHFNASSTDGKFPGGRVYVQESADGKTGWKTLGWAPLTGNGSNLPLQGFVDNPHGYWRLYVPAAPGYAAGVSNVLHAFRYKTAITGALPSARTIRKGSTLTFTGSLHQQGYGAWTAMHGATVQLVYRPTGSNTWYLAARGSTSTSGAFTFHVRDTRSATWAVVYITADNWHVDAVGPQTYVRVD